MSDPIDPAKLRALAHYLDAELGYRNGLYTNLPSHSALWVRLAADEIERLRADRMTAADALQIVVNDEAISAGRMREILAMTPDEQRAHWIATHYTVTEELNRLRADAERLDWLEQYNDGGAVVWHYNPDEQHATLRAAIDAARKEKP